MPYSQFTCNARLLSTVVESLGRGRCCALPEHARRTSNISVNHVCGTRQSDDGATDGRWLLFIVLLADQHPIVWLKLLSRPLGGLLIGLRCLSPSLTRSGEGQRNDSWQYKRARTPLRCLPSQKYLFGTLLRRFHSWPNAERRVRSTSESCVIHEGLGLNRFQFRSLLSS